MTALQTLRPRTSGKQVKQFTAGCLFSGMGGFASGVADAGFQIKWASDVDEFACAAFRHRFPEVRLIEKDVCELSVEKDELCKVDILTAGFPCQSFSQAGNRLGFDDPRGELFFEIPRLLQEFGFEKSPKLVILENVPFLQYGGDLKWFDMIQRELRKSGYWFRNNSCWTINVKDATELPQDRERLFMVAASREYFTRNPFLPPITSSKRKSSLTIEDFVDRSRKGDDDSYLNPENKYFKKINEEIQKGESQNNIYQLRRSYVREKKDGLCPTLTANMGSGGHNVPFVCDNWGIRKLTVEEVAKLQGFKIDNQLFPDIPDSEKYRLLGNAACVHLVNKVAKICFTILKESENGI